LNYKCKTSDDINGVIKGFFAKFWWLSQCPSIFVSFF
jgi:hypothetical protein